MFIRVYCFWEETQMGFIIQLIAGAIGGNAAGMVLKKYSLGTLWNSVVGILGGGLGGQVLGMFNLSIGGGGLDIASIVGQILSGGVGGGILLVIVGVVKKMLGK
tara:strand:+ start:121 stop:432 length:312 start_codon:yes stop_codon:yes gene_type:complete